VFEGSQDAGAFAPQRHPMAREAPRNIVGQLLVGVLESVPRGFVEPVNAPDAFRNRGGRL
jgi:hypothetical protein